VSSQYGREEGGGARAWMKSDPICSASSVVASRSSSAASYITAVPAASRTRTMPSSSTEHVSSRNWIPSYLPARVGQPQRSPLSQCEIHRSVGGSGATLPLSQMALAELTSPPCSHAGKRASMLGGASLCIEQHQLARGRAPEHVLHVPREVFGARPVQLVLAQAAGRPDHARAERWLLPGLVFGSALRHLELGGEGDLPQGRLCASARGRWVLQEFSASP